MSNKEITAAQELMKLAINKQSHVDSLLGYYRDQIDAYNDERAEWVIHYDGVKINSDDTGLLDREIRTENQKLTDLKSKLAVKKAELTHERQRYFKLLQQGQDKKKKLEESKQNYRQMMNACKPINLNNKHLNNSSIYSVGGNKKKEESKLGQFKETGNSKTTNLQLQLINLKKEHQERKRMMRNKVDELKNELETLLDEYTNREDQCKSEYRAALAKLGDLEAKNMALTAEYFRCQMNGTEDEQRLQEENEMIRLKNMAMLQKLQTLKKNHTEEFNTVESQVKRQNKQFKEKYDKQLKKKEEHLIILKEQHERLQDIYLNKIKKLEQQLKSTSKKRATLQEKGRVEISSLKSQIKILRSRIDKAQIQQMREDILNDGEEEGSESLDVSELDKINREVREIEHQLDSK